ncbi:protein phosphatase 2C domain-containing protein [Streptomyces polygonati]|uniref:Protein phosphatase 2C domain-containing protein n=1 Tax=Streptomyces polygonati TaxID=1617087 RepID=A0ABV8HT20_9ACTN
MRLRFDAVSVPRIGGVADDGEDACGFDEGAGLAVVCDGAGSQFASREWARCLVRRFIAEPEPLLYGDPAAWVTAAGADWRAGLDLHAAGDRVRRAANGGSGATIAAVRATTSPGGHLLDVSAVGDTCVYVVRDGRPHFAHPIAVSGEFPARPPLVTTWDTDPPARASLELRTGDTVILATDATARWAATRPAGDWEKLVRLTIAHLADLLTRRRDRGEIADDDLTLLRGFA